MKRAALVAVFGAMGLGAILACGSSSSSPSATPGDAGADVTNPFDGNLGPDAADAAAGSNSADSAGDEDASAGDASDASYLDAADAAHWDANGPPFLCGPNALQCFTVTQFCSQVTAPHGGVFYNCITAPGSCWNDVSCGCIADAGEATDCFADAGEVFTISVEP